MNKTENTTDKNATQNVDKDFPLTHLPKDHRKSFLSVAAVLLGITFFSPTMAAGAQIASAFYLKDLVWIMLLGNLILGVYVAINCAIGAKTGLTSVMLARYTLGKAGAKWAGFLLGGTQIGWFAYVSSYVGHLYAVTFELQAYETYITLAWALIFGVTAIWGYKAMEKIAFVAVPALLILVFYIPVVAIDAAGGLGEMAKVAPTAEMSIASAMTIIVGTFASMGTQACNWSRFAKNTKTGFWAGLIAFLIGNLIMLIAGIVGSLAYAESDFIIILMNLGLASIALVVLTLNIWTTAHAGAYSWAVAGSEAFNKQNKTPFLVAGLVIALVLAATGIYNQLLGFLNLLGIFIPPLGGVFLGDYLFTYKRKLPRVEFVNFKMLRFAPIASYAVGAIVAYVTNSLNFGIPPLFGIIVALLFIPVFNKILSAMKIDDMHGVLENANYV